MLTFNSAHDATTFPMYRDKRLRMENRECKECEPFNKVLEDNIPPIQIPNVINGVTYELRIYDCEGALVTTIDDATLQNYVVSGSKRSLILGQDFSDNEIVLAAGVYRVELDINSTTYYSDDFQVLPIAQSSIFDGNCEYNLVKLSWNNTCGESFMNDELLTSDDYSDYLWIPYGDGIFPTNYEYQVEGIENGKGVFCFTYKTLQKRYRLRIPVPDYAIGGLNAMLMSDVVGIEMRLSDYIGFGITNVELSYPDDFTTECYQIMDITFQLDQNFRGSSTYNSSKCCDVKLYEDPIDICDPNNGGGSTDCDDLDVELNFDAVNEQLEADVTGCPTSTPITYRWYYIAANGAVSLLSETSESLNLTQYGEYRVTVICGDCTVSETFLYQNPCANFGAGKTVSGSSITYTPNGGSPTYMWEYEDTLGTRTTLPNTSNVHVAQNTGYYIFTMTEGGCQFTDTTYININDCSGKSVTITVNSDELEANGTGCTGVATFQWYLDEGSGFNSIGVGSTVMITNSGNYRVTMACDGCTVSADQVIILEPDCCNDLMVEITESAGVLTAVVTNCNDDSIVDWYYYDNNNFSEVGSGNTYDAGTDYGIYKAVVLCGECEKEAYYCYEDCDDECEQFEAGAATPKAVCN